MKRIINYFLSLVMVLLLTSPIPAAGFSKGDSKGKDSTVTHRLFQIENSLSLWTDEARAKKNLRNL